MSPDHADRVHASDDPLLASLGLTLLFFALCLWRIEIPGTHYFDEIHYLPAARELLAKVHETQFAELKADILQKLDPPPAKP